jgi:hypothetical protein
MDVTRRYYEEVDDFIRALGRNAHRRRHLPFWNLALGALASSEAAANQSSSSPALAALSSGSLGSSTSNIIQSAVTDVAEPVAVFSRALASATGRVLYVTFHTTPNSHVAPMSYSTASNISPNEDILVASVILSTSLIVIFCADDTLDNLVAAWTYAEIANAHRSRANMAQASSSTAPTTSKIPQSASVDKLAAKSLSSIPSSFKSLRFGSRVSLYGSLAHVRALLDLASNAARDPKLSFTNGDPSIPRRFIPSDYRMSRDDSGMRVLGGRSLRVSTRPTACEFGFGPSVFKRRTRNAYRLFFIATERLEAIDKAYAEAATSALVGASPTPSNSAASVPIHDTSKLIIDAAKCLRLAVASDWDDLKAILRNENTEPDPNAEEDDGEFDATLEALQKGNVYLWESSRPVKTGKPGRPKIRCFAVLEFHTRPLPELSCVEIIDLHVSNPKRDTETARMLTESLSRKFLTTTLAAPAPYHFLFVKVDVSVPESSDRFLLDCGFIADSVADFVTLESVVTRDRSHVSPQQDPFEITRVVKVSPLTEKPFSAYEIKVVETGELVRKRYREFDKLYFQLKAQLVGIAVPKLPKKKFFGNMDESFVEKRRLQLQLWLNTVSRLPGVEESGWVSNFLWTDLKIRGVKGISEVERLHRTLQRQADEARQQAVQSAATSLSAQSSPSLAWPSKAPQAKASTSPRSSNSSSGGGALPDTPPATSSLSPPTVATDSAAKTTKASKPARERRKGRRLSQ